MKKILSIVGIVVVVVIVVVVLFLGSIVKTAIETVGPEVAGVSMTVDKVRVQLLGGNVRVKGLVIGNPEGFNTPSAMKLGDFKVDLKVASLLTDTIVIKQILIDAPEITYEKGLKSSNLSTLVDNLAPAEEQEEPVEEEAEKPKKKKDAAKKVIIEDFQLNNAKVNVTITALGGKKMTLPLPNIQMQDIGKDTGGTDIQEVISEVFASITDAIGSALASSGDFAGDALKDAGGALKDIGGSASESVKDAAGNLKKGIGGLFGKE